jgi:uncharacterized protein YwqG
MEEPFCKTTELPTKPKSNRWPMESNAEPLMFLQTVDLSGFSVRLHG